MLAAVAVAVIFTAAVSPVFAALLHSIKAGTSKDRFPFSEGLKKSITAHSMGLNTHNFVTSLNSARLISIRRNRARFITNLSINNHSIICRNSNHRLASRPSR